MFAAKGQDYDFSQLTARTYHEYGLTEGFSVGSSVAHAQQQVVGDDYAIYLDGIAQAEIFAQFALPADHTRASSIRLTGVFRTSTFVRGQRAMGQDAAIGLSWLEGVGNDRAFAEAEFGYRRSLGDDADQLRLHTTIGLKHRGGMLLARTFHTKGLFPKDPEGIDYDLGQLGISAVLPIRKRMKLEIGARTDLYTRGIDPGSTAFFSIWWGS
ncbi:hypothetical protein GCM10007148_16070 [Parvularcula lutaonensis]|nr:hypothetical protein GCM10007148_16070 [Parvularcula lutaonensis]